jgi:hypothetical protein
LKTDTGSLSLEKIKMFINELLTRKISFCMNHRYIFGNIESLAKVLGVNKKSIERIIYESRASGYLIRRINKDLINLYLSTKFAS